MRLSDQFLSLTTRKVWATHFMCVIWNLWKQINEKVCREKFKPPLILVTGKAYIGRGGTLEKVL